jgi:hypothetical protein
MYCMYMRNCAYTAAFLDITILRKKSSTVFLVKKAFCPDGGTAVSLFADFFIQLACRQLPV